MEPSEDEFLSCTRPQSPEDHPVLDRIGLRYLLVHHFSSAWGTRTAEFAFYLYLIAYFKDTLLPSSIFGFAMTFTGIVLSRWAGHLVDKHDKLTLVRYCIAVQKLSAIAAYACFALMFSHPYDATAFLQSLVLFVLVVLAACMLHISTTCISIAIERDWTTCLSISDTQTGTVDSTILAKLNTYLRQINLLCKLLAPLFVSFLTVYLKSSYAGSVNILATLTITAMIFEFYWINIVYDRFPALASEQAKKNRERSAANAATPEHRPLLASDSEAEAIQEIHEETRPTSLWHSVKAFLKLEDWEELVHLPVFLSSVSVSLLYLTVLSFDGTMLSYLKTLSFKDDFLAEMRGLCVLTGLLGTMLAMPLEQKVGSVRAGNWSIWSMVFCLAPVIIAFNISGSKHLDSGPNGYLAAALLFGGMALSRVGLWSFDLIQTKQLQNALTTHPRRNTLTALQYTMQSVADLLKYILTMILYRPSEFRWAALASFLSVSSGAIVYMLYVKKERGHITHIRFDWIKKIL